MDKQDTGHAAGTRQFRPALSLADIAPEWIRRFFRVALWIYVAALSFGALAEPVGLFDDSLPLVHGMLIERGKTPDVDFYTMYPPLDLYAHAGAFRLLGETVIAPRLIAIGLYIGVIMLAARMLKRRLSPNHFAALGSLLLLAIGAGREITQPPWSAFALALMGLLIYISTSRTTGFAIAGALTGLSMLFRFNFAAYVVAVAAIDLLLGLLPKGSGPSPNYQRDSVRRASAFAIPMLMFAAIPLTVIFGRNTGTAISDFLTWPLHYMPRRFIQLEPQGHVIWALACVPGWFFLRMLQSGKRIPRQVLAPVLCAAALILTASIRRDDPQIVLVLIGMEVSTAVLLHFFVFRLERTELLLILSLCFMEHYFLTRADDPHWVLIPIVAILVFPFLLVPPPTAEEHESSPLSQGTVLAILCVALFYLVTGELYRPEAGLVKNGLKLAAITLGGPHVSDGQRMLGDSVPDAAWSTVYTDKDELAALRYVRERTGDNEPVYAGVEDHARVYTNDMRIYWLIGRPIATRTFQLEPWIASEAPLQGQMIEDMETRSVKWAILEKEPDGFDKTFALHPHVGSDLLDKYLASHFRTAAQFGRFRVVAREN